MAQQEIALGSDFAAEAKEMVTHVLLTYAICPSHTPCCLQASNDAAQSGRAMDSNRRAKLCIAMIKVGNAGLTLTGATRVYLMEPWLDPSMEVQVCKPRNEESDHESKVKVDRSAKP
eukprot:6191741-Pleurochrysis_carterae.AAC.2